jgi:hypothetical protein
MSSLSIRFSQKLGRFEVFITTSHGFEHLIEAVDSLDEAIEIFSNTLDYFTAVGDPLDGDIADILTVYENYDRSFLTAYAASEATGYEPDIELCPEPFDKLRINSVEGPAEMQAEMEFAHA